MVKTEDIQGFASRIHKEAQRLLALISDIIKLSELDERDLAIAFEDVDLYQIAEECLSLIHIFPHKVLLPQRKTLRYQV